MNELQLGLFEIAPTVQFSAPKTATIDERCDAFIAANPHGWRTFVRLAVDAKRRGRTQWSADGIFHVMRWAHSQHVTAGTEAYRLPNDFTSRFARKAMAEVAELSGFFATREIKTP